MTKTTKIIIAIAIIVILGGAIYYFNRKKDPLAGAGGSDQFSIDDDAAYKACRALFSAGDLAWIDKKVAEVYAQKRPGDMINGRVSKTLVFVNVTGEMNPNPEGKEKDRSGAKTLWPQSRFDTMWGQYRQPLEAKYGGL